MGMYINSATGSLALTRSLYQTSVMQTNILKRLSSGIRINSASDDAAGLSLSQKITSVINGNTIAKNNAQTGIAMLNTADGALSVMTNSLERIRNLAVQAANGVYSASERQMLQKEVSQLSDDISQSYQSAKFSDKNVFGAQQGVSVGTTQTQSITEAQAVAMGYNDAHIIRTAADFKTKITNDTGGNFVMVNDIDLSQLGLQDRSVINNDFTGTLDGNGHSANNLSITPHASILTEVGLFKQISGTVKNLSVDNATINAPNTEFVGLLVGSVRPGGTVINCSTSGTISAKQHVGGLAGFVNGGATVSNSSSSANASGVTFGWRVGGLVGQNNGTISKSYSSGSASGVVAIGGLVGQNAGGTIDNSTSSANVSASDQTAGGFVGYQSGTITNSSASGNVFVTNTKGGGFVGWGAAGSITNSYATGNVSTSLAWGGQVGGFAGQNDVSITNSYSTGSVSGNFDVGGFVGAGSNISNCYTTSNVSGVIVGQTGGFNGNTTATNNGTNFYKNNMSIDRGTSSVINGNVAPLPTASWDANSWDISGGLPALKNVARAYGSATTLVGLQIGDDERLSSKIDINTAFGLGDVSFSVSNQNSAQDVIAKADQLMTFLNTMRSQVGSSINKLSSVMQIQDNRVTNLSASKSTINDADMAAESAKLIQNQIRNQAATTLMSQTKGLDANLLMQLIG